MASDDCYRIIYEEARATVEHQIEEIENVRQGAGRALGVASVVLGVSAGLGSQAIHEAAQYTAIGLLLLSLGIVVWVWWPRSWYSGIVAQKAIDTMLEHRKVNSEEVGPLALGEMYRQRALHLDEVFEANNPKLERLQWGVQAVLVLTAMVIVTVVVGGV